MPVLDKYDLVDPKAIIIMPKRQRSEINIDDLLPSIKQHGVLNPIIVRQDELNGIQQLILMAGERRLTCCLKLERLVPIRYFDTLDPIEAKIIELEENLKRDDLPWRDEVRGFGEIHNLYKSRNPKQRPEDTAESLNMDPRWLRELLDIYAQLDSKSLAEATGIRHAYNILQRLSERRSAAIVGEMSELGANTFGSKKSTELGTVSETVASSSSASSTTISPPPPKPTPDPVLCTSFLDWAPAYTGPKFNLIHCDFPYGVFMGGNFGAIEKDLYENDPEIFWKLTDCLCANLDRFTSYSAHVLFWFSMNFYEETKRRLSAAGLVVFNHPIIWMKTDGKGIAPTGHPKRVYDTALLAVRGNRPFVKQMANGYPAPTPSNALHPSHKSEPMLRFFFQALVDETTSVLDPTCGSGSALRAAEDCGATKVLGLEYNKDYATAANAATFRARNLRILGRSQSEL